MTLSTLARNWWMIAIRGNLAMVFGITLLVWPNITLPTVVVLFAAYAIVDGSWAVASTIALARRFVVVPLLLEGVASVAFGVIALSSPLVSRDFIRLVAGWGVITGLFELVAAGGLPRETNAHWLWGTAGMFSLFLAILIQLVPDAELARYVYVIGMYAVVFGLVVVGAAYRFRVEHRKAVGRLSPALR
jgi:uncharacterized membrane protein HdeD (DUF308 family)